MARTLETLQKTYSRTAAPSARNASAMALPIP